jgi:hypothetical protein
MGKKKQKQEYGPLGRGQVEVDFGKISRIIRYDLNAVCDLEKRLGSGQNSMPFLKIVTGLGFREIREGLFVGLLRKSGKMLEKKPLTPERVGRLMDDSGHTYFFFGAHLLQALSEATAMDLSEPIAMMRAQAGLPPIDEDDEDDDDEDEAEGTPEGDEGNS